jgi:UDP-N-acetylglucosamine:LPS N-acetylglucosamine transferase
MSSIALTGGGTAGHITPNLALVPELKKCFSGVFYLGGSGMEKTLVPKAGLEFFETPTAKFDRKNLFSDLIIPYKLLKGISAAKKNPCKIKAGRRLFQRRLRRSSRLLRRQKLGNSGNSARERLYSRPRE